MKRANDFKEDLRAARPDRVLYNGALKNRVGGALHFGARFVVNLRA